MTKSPFFETPALHFKNAQIWITEIVKFMALSNTIGIELSMLKVWLVYH